MSEKQDADHDHGDDDLLADFRDVLHDDAGTQGTSRDDDEELADLDAFLNEFGQGEGEGAGAGGQQADAGVLSEFDAVTDTPAAEVVPELGADDIVQMTPAHEALDLDLESAAEVAPDALDAYVSDLDDHQGAPAAPVMTQAPDMFGTDDTGSAGTVAYQAPDDELIADEEGTPVGKRIDVSTIGVSLFSLVIAAVVGWFAVSLHSQVAELRSAMARLGPQRPAVAGVSPQLEGQLANINQRLDALTASAGHAGGDPAQLTALNGRLDDLGKAVATLHEQVAVLQKTQAARPAPKSKPVANKPAAKTKAAAKPQPKRVAAGGVWVVNVVSLSDEKSAHSELARLQREGIKNTAVEKVVMNGRTWYRVRVTGFASREEAQVYADMIKNKLAGSPWVGHR